MPVCDICNKCMDFSDGYALPTELVTTSEEYWLFMLNRFIHNDEGLLASSVQLQAKQRSGWLLCESCSKLFAFDRHQAKEYATRQMDPPGRGPANVSSVAAAAAKAWKKLHGKWPSWVR